MDKYVIRNCPCFFEENEEVNDYTCSWCDTEELACQDCTDCVIKQIVELCKENLNSLETYVDVRSFECVALQDILKLLDIREVR